MTVILKTRMYQDLEDNVLWHYLDKIDYPFCREGEDYRTWYAGTEFTGCFFRGYLEVFLYPNLLDTRLKIPEMYIWDSYYMEVIRE